MRFFVDNWLSLSQSHTYQSQTVSENQRQNLILKLTHNTSIMGSRIVASPPTHSVGGQTSNSGWRLSSSVSVCNAPRPASYDVMPPAV